MKTMTIGEKIRDARKKAGFTQKELGKSLGVSAAMVSLYETGARNPKISTLKKLADALGVSYKSFLPD